MRLRRLVLASLTLAAATLTHPNAEAQTAPDVTFDAVTSYIGGIGPSGYYSLTITGIQHGATTSSTVVAEISGQTWNTPPNTLTQGCERDLQVMVNRPGRFALGLFRPTALTACSLTQLP